MILSSWRSLVSLQALSLLLLAACSKAPSTPDLKASEVTRKTAVYLIVLEDKGSRGPAVGCGDSVVPLTVNLPAPSPALEGALSNLLAAGKSYEALGFYNALANSPLKVQRIERAGGTARIYLTGYLELGGECDSPRVLAQLEQTATQFDDVDKAELYLDEKPLADLLSGKG
jgi:hypothetical protein